MNDDRTMEFVKEILRAIKVRERNGGYEVKYPKVCKECGRKFTTFRKSKRYCSRQCVEKLKNRVFPLWGEENIKKGSRQSAN